MSRIVRIFCILAVLCFAVPPSIVGATGPALPLGCIQTTKDQETIVTCIPQLWNHDLVVFAHGYEFANPDPTPLLGQEQWTIKLSGGSTITLPELLMSLGYGFAATSYSKNGLAVQEGVTDMKALVDDIRAHNLVRNVYIVGASEGGLVTTLSLELYPDTYKGGLALCGPVGDFQKQINYWGDFRTAFDVYFPGLHGSPILIPPPPGDDLMVDWVSPGSVHQAWVKAQLVSDQTKAGQLMAVTGAAYSPTDPTTVGTTTIGILYYNILATNEARVELGNIQPYDNTANVVLQLLPGVHTYAADAGTAAALLPYQTKGILKKPLVTLHNELDPIVPSWHEGLYKAKAALAGSSMNLTQLAVPSYGHCNFTPGQTLFAFAMMLYKANHLPINPAAFGALLALDTNGVADFTALNLQYGDISKVKLFFPVMGK